MFYLYIEVTKFQHITGQVQPQHILSIAACDQSNLIVPACYQDMIYVVVSTLETMVSKKLSVKNDSYTRYDFPPCFIPAQATISRTSMARTPLQPWKYVRDRGSSSKWVLIIATGQEA